MTDSPDRRMLLPVDLDGPGSAPPGISAGEVAGVDAALGTAVRLARETAPPGSGSTLRLWSALATVAAHDLEAARAIEPHLDAIAILDQAGPVPLPPVAAEEGCTWGVFASEGPAPVRAVHDSAGWVLHGTKAWCSLADRLDAALVSAALDDGRRGLFAVDLHHAGVRVVAGAWHARGLVAIPSGPVELDGVPATAVGEPGWYVERPGFAWGGIGVAACWLGGAVGLARTVRDASRRRPERDLTAMHAGALDAGVWAASRVLADAAARVDDGRATGDHGRILVERVRTVVAAVCEDAILRAGHALGPAPLALDAAHAQRVADLQLYVRQHHAEADLATLGQLSVASADR